MKAILTVLRKGLGFALVLTALAPNAFALFADEHAPEIDAGSAASALTLLLGGAALLRDRFRAK
ncbi:MAG: hypothetical protein ACT4QC_13320 [Planctomycetaceae bacterium]